MENTEERSGIEPKKAIDKLELVKALNSKVRLRVILLLFIYQKLSLSDLSEKLKRTKNTVIYHMNLLSEQGFLDEFDEKINGSIKPIKYYKLNEEFLEAVFQPFEDPSNLSEEDILEYSHSVIKWNALLFETIREFLKELNNFYLTNEKEIYQPQQALNFHQQNRTPRDLVPLSENGFNEYLKEYQNFMKKIVSYLEKENREAPDVIRPFLAFNAIIPIKTLLESKNIEKKKQ